MPATTNQPATTNSFIQPHDVLDPTPGTFNNPTKKPDVGGDSPPSSKAVNPPKTGNDYTGWNWEQTLVGVLGLALPSRDEIANQAWTAINFNSPGGPRMYRIYAPSGGHHTATLAYPTPTLLP